MKIEFSIHQANSFKSAVFHKLGRHRRQVNFHKHCEKQLQIRKQAVHDTLFYSAISRTGIHFIIIIIYACIVGLLSHFVKHTVIKDTNILSVQYCTDKANFLFPFLLITKSGARTVQFSCKLNLFNLANNDFTDITMKRA